jgi:hypothetical protein
MHTHSLVWGCAVHDVTTGHTVVRVGRRDWADYEEGGQWEWWMKRCRLKVAEPELQWDALLPLPPRQHSPQVEAAFNSLKQV